LCGTVRLEIICPSIDAPPDFQDKIMTTQGTKFIAALAITTLLYGCDSGSNGTSQPNQPPPTGTISVSLTDGPREDASEMVLHVTGIEMGHADGRIVNVGMAGGPMEVDMMQLQNGMSVQLVDGVEVPMGQYEWMRLSIDPALSHVGLANTGGHHSMQMGSNAADGLEVHDRFEIGEREHSEFMLDFDTRLGLQHHSGGMMGDRYELHSAMRMVHMGEAGGMRGIVDPSMIDVNHAACDDLPGGNWVYLFPGDAAQPDDIAMPDTDGMAGPMAVDRVELDTMTGDHRYHFAYLEPGTYRLAMTCSGEWDEDSDDDYPSDPDGQFGFQMFSDPVEVMAGQMHDIDLMP
jgi:uncharacterized protein DUF4382